MEVVQVAKKVNVKLTKETFLQLIKLSLVVKVKKEPKVILIRMLQGYRAEEDQ